MRRGYIIRVDAPESAAQAGRDSPDTTSVLDACLTGKRKAVPRESAQHPFGFEPSAIPEFLDRSREIIGQELLLGENGEMRSNNPQMRPRRLDLFQTGGDFCRRRFALDFKMAKFGYLGRCHQEM